jgi:hypothetical protein
MMILAAVVGPSSAILMLPSTGWWENTLLISSVECYGCQGIHLFLAANSSTLWPTQVSLVNFMPSDCNFRKESIPQHCPAVGLSYLLDQAPLIPIETISLTIPMTARAVGGYDRSLASSRSIAHCPEGNNTQAMSSRPKNVGEECTLARTTATTLDQMLQWSIAPLPGSRDSNASVYFTETKGKNVRYHLHFLNGTATLAPQTFSICLSTDFNIWRDENPSAANLVFPSRNGIDWAADASPLLNSWPTQDGAAAIWIEPTEMAKNTPSIDMALIFVINAATDPIGYTIRPSIQLVTCSLYASWQPIDVYIYSGPNSDIQYPTNEKLFDGMDSSLVTGRQSVNLETGDGLHVQLDIDWAKSALSTNDTIIKLLDKVPKADWDPAGLVGTSISLLTADTMARIGMDVNLIFAVDSAESSGGLATQSEFESKPTPLVMLTADINPNDTTALSITTLRNGYSYSVVGTTRRLASAVLLTHILIALVHTVLIKRILNVFKFYFLKVF